MPLVVFQKYKIPCLFYIKKYSTKKIFRPLDPHVTSKKVFILQLFYGLQQNILYKNKLTQNSIFLGVLKINKIKTGTIAEPKIVSCTPNHLHQFFQIFTSTETSKS